MSRFVDLATIPSRCSRLLCDQNTVVQSTSGDNFLGQWLGKYVSKYQYLKN